MRTAYLFSSSSATKGEEQPISTRFLSVSISFNEIIKVGRNHVEKVGADTDIFITLRVLFQSLSVSILRLKNESGQEIVKRQFNKLSTYWSTPKKCEAFNVLALRMRIVGQLQESDDSSRLLSCMPKRTYQPSKTKRIMKYGFRARLKNFRGRSLLKRRIRKGRKKITES